MESLIDLLDDADIFNEFINSLNRYNNIPDYEIDKLSSIFNSDRYKSLVSDIKSNSYQLDIPNKHLINKGNSMKKRVVYTFNEEYNLLFKILSTLLHKYDDTLSKNCYSYIKGSSVFKAVKRITTLSNLNKLYCYKVDISSYFNTIDKDLLILTLREYILDDPKLLKFLINLVSIDKVVFKDNLIQESIGALPGVSISSFFATIYLDSLDKEFKDVVYARYSDDIIVFARDLELLDQYIKQIKSHLRKMLLTINLEKEKIIFKGFPFEFLGFSYDKGIIDIASHTYYKLKLKIRRKARALLRWRKRVKVDHKKAIKVFFRVFKNKLLFRDLEVDNELNWSRFYFPLINTSKTIYKIDQYILDSARYIYKGRHLKKDYQYLTYDSLKLLGYKSLLNAYYRYKKHELGENSNNS